MHQRAGRIDQAQTLFQEALEISLSRHGPDHPSTLAVKNNLALTYWQEGRLDKSSPLMEETLGSFRLVRPPNDPNLLITAANLGASYLDAGRVNDAIPLLEEAQRGMGSRPDMRWITDRLFGALLQADATPALEHWSVVLEGMRRAPGEDDPATIAALNNYGYALARSRRFAEAEAMLEEAIEREVRVLGEGHMLLLQTRTNLGEMYLLQERHARAAEIVASNVLFACMFLLLLLVVWLYFDTE